jgi:phage terminase large subunit-like protein
MDLSKLSKAEKLALLDALEEKRQRELKKAPAYAPNAGQMQVHKSKASTRVVFSGNGAGKSALAANEVLWMAKGHNPIAGTFSQVPARIIVLLDSPSKITDQWIPELQKWHTFKEDQFHKRGKPTVSQITFANGSEILFFTHDQSPLSFESVELDYLVADEPPPRQVFVALRRGARKAGTTPKFLLVGTPIAASWMRTELWDPFSRGELPDTECFRFDSTVNKANLAEGYIESFSKLLTEKERAIRIEGQFFDLDGLALAHLLKRDKHVIRIAEWSARNPCVVVVDPHPSKAHVAVMVGVDREGRYYVLKEHAEKLIARQFTKKLIDLGWFNREKYNVVDIVFDSLGSADTTSGEGFRSFGEVMNEVLLEHRIGRARATSYDDKSDEEWIERIRDVLAIPEVPDNYGQCAPKLRFSTECPRSYHDAENVQWAQYARSRGMDESKPVLDIRNRDQLACIKYALASNLYPKKSTAVKAYYPKQSPTAYGAAPLSKPKILHLRRK